MILGLDIGGSYTDFVLMEKKFKRLATIQTEAHSLANMLIGKKCKELPQITEIDDLFGDE